MAATSIEQTRVYPTDASDGALDFRRELSSLNDSQVVQRFLDGEPRAFRELVDRYEALFGKAPRVKHREHLWRRVAWKLQEQRFGGLSTVAKRRIDELIEQIDLPLTADRAQPKSPVHRVNGEPQVGTTLVRVWRDREIHATRTEEGWECDGVVHGSLTAVARAATGSHRSGRAFFGLTKRKERSA